MSKRYPLEYRYIVPGGIIENNNPPFRFTNKSNAILAIKVKEVD